MLYLLNFYILILLIIFVIQNCFTLCYFQITIKYRSSILWLFYIQSLAVQNRLGESLSPQLDSTCMYCMRRFIEGYLIPNEENYLEVNTEMYRASQTLICLGSVGHDVGNSLTMLFDEYRCADTWHLLCPALCKAEHTHTQNSPFTILDFPTCSDL